MVNMPCDAHLPAGACTFCACCRAGDVSDGETLQGEQYSGELREQGEELPGQPLLVPE